MPEFDNHKLSIVIQGKVDNTQHNNGKSITQLSIDSCRKFFPGAEIILSTWSGDNFDLENFDKLVLSEDLVIQLRPGLKLRILEDKL